MKIRPVGADCGLTDRRTDRQTCLSVSLSVIFRSFVKVPKIRKNKAFFYKKCIFVLSVQ
jgi:hypothetical protein